MNLFETTTCPTDPYFRALRDEARFSDMRRHVEELWGRFSPYADPSFISEIARSFLARYWEMYLGCSLLDLNFDLRRNLGTGPDFDASGPDYRVLLEAVSVGPGVGDDAVPSQLFGGSEAQVTPTTQIILRICSAILDKRRQHARHTEAALIPPDIPFVVAVHLGGITNAETNSVVPLSVSACLGVKTVLYPVGGGESAAPIAIPHSSVLKSSGAEIDARLFLQSESIDVSGLLLSSVHPFSIPSEGGGYEFLHNPQAGSPVRRGWFKKGIEYWVEDGRLLKADHDSGS